MELSEAEIRMAEAEEEFKQTEYKMFDKMFKNLKEEYLVTFHREIAEYIAEEKIEAGVFFKEIEKELLYKIGEWSETRLE